MCVLQWLRAALSTDMVAELLSRSQAMVAVVLFYAAAAGEILGAQRGGQSHFGVGDGGGLEFDRRHFTFENNTMGCLFQEVYSVKPS